MSPCKPAWLHKLLQEVMTTSLITKHGNIIAISVGGYQLGPYIEGQIILLMEARLQLDEVE